MNKVTLSILVGMASAGAGAVAGYFLATKVLDEKYGSEYEKKLNEEIENLRASHKRMVEKRGQEVVDHKESIDPGKTEEIPSVNPYREMVAKIEYNKIPHAPSKEDEEPDKDITDEEIEYDENGERIIDRDDEIYVDQSGEWDDKPPTIISLKEYTELDTYLDFVTFHYYMDDDVLVDDGDMPIDDIEHVVGDALVHFGDEAAALSNGDDDAVYVVNGRMNLAIEIVRLHASYQETNGF